MKISVIMPSFLGEYSGCSPDRKNKFIRAVDSFLSQTYEEKELVVIADGCPDTKAILLSKYRKPLNDGRIVLVEYARVVRNEPFIGHVRQKGISKATGVIITNLDTDDILGPNHLYNIAVSFGNADWVFWNIIDNSDELNDKFATYRDMKAELGSINNGCIAWKKDLKVSWSSCDGVHDNQAFIAQLLTFTNHKKIYGCSYTNCHLKIIIQKV